MKLLVRPDGSAFRVTILQSSGSKKIDKEIVTGAMHWRFEPSDQEREIFHGVLINLRR